MTLGGKYSGVSWGYGLTVQPDGKILTVGLEPGDVNTNGTIDSALVRYDSDGTLDTTFGGGDGIADLPLPGYNTEDHIVAVQTDGRILVGIGTSLVRLTASGVFDASFGDDGIVAIDLPGISSIALQADGRILVAGSSGNDFVLVRLRANGGTDTTFGGDGSLIIAVGAGAQATDLLVQPDGQIVVAGYRGAFGAEDFFVARVMGGGVPDQSTPVGENYRFTFSPNLFTDADGDALTYSATLANGAALPAWLSFAPAARTFSGTPGSADQGLHSLRLTASDGTLNATDIYTLKVGHFGTPGADSITGTSASDLIESFAGDDTLDGRGGRDTLNGGSGRDLLTGVAGNDALLGLDGNDTLRGGAGKDTLTGSAGLDKYDFNTTLNASTNVDTITDYSLVDDLMVLDDDFFTGLSTGALTGARFYKAAGATQGNDPGDRVVYNTSNGRLYFDVDGSGPQGSVWFATLGGSPDNLAAADFLIVG